MLCLGERQNILIATFLLAISWITGLRASGQQNPPEGSAKQVEDIIDVQPLDPNKKALLQAGPVEDWTVLTPPSGMKFDALLAEQDPHESYTRELLELTWRLGDSLDVWVVRPNTTKNPPVILYLYSYPSDLERYKNLDFCKFVTQNGFAAVGFLSALTGPRYHERPLKEWFISNLQESMGSSVHDVQMVLNYLAARGDLDMTRVGMFGDGSGASIAIMAAAADSRIKVLDLLDPWGDWPDWLAKSSLVPEKERAAYVKPEFLQKVENLDPVKWLPQLRTQQVRLQSITKGITVTPDVARERLEAAAPPNVKIVHYESSEEFIKNVASTGKAFDWIKAQLELPASAEKSTSVAKSEALRKDDNVRH